MFLRIIVASCIVVEAATLIRGPVGSRALPFLEVTRVPRCDLFDLAARLIQDNISDDPPAESPASSSMAHGDAALSPLIHHVDKGTKDDHSTSALTIWTKGIVDEVRLPDDPNLG
jgi:hypothetical protein